MKNICKYNECTGCSACVNICPRGSISLVEDIYGELHPFVDQNSCVDCKLCQNICPNNQNLTFSYPLRCMASWIEDNEKRKICASGGIGTVLSEFVIKNNGIVFGSRYDENLNPIMTYTDTLEDIEFFKGSRYVQSVVSESTFKQVKEFLKEGRLVLFVGTPCQIAGLKCFIKVDYPNLITVDLICHGVCPTSFLKDEIKYLSKKFNLNDVADVRFRGNDGNNFRLTIWNKEGRKLYPRNNHIQKITYSDESEQYYIKGFLLGVTMRENCYECKYARPERISDITIGDFIGLGKEIPFGYSTKNVSSVLINTKKGEDFYQNVSEYTVSLKNEVRLYKERLQYKPSLVHPFERHVLNTKFKELYIKYGFTSAIRNVLKDEMYDIRKKYYKKLPKNIFKSIFRSTYYFFKQL